MNLPLKLTPFRYIKISRPHTEIFKIFGITVYRKEYYLYFDKPVNPLQELTDKENETNNTGGK